MAASLSNLHLLASHLNRWTYATRDSFSFCWMPIKWLMDVWMSELHIFKWRESLISSHILCKVKASNISILTNPLDFAWASLVLISPINSEAVSMSVSQSSNCEESFPFNVGISCNKELSKDVFFWALHKVSVYLSNTSPMGSEGGQSVIANWLSFYSKCVMASLGSLSLSSTVISIVPSCNLGVEVRQCFLPDNFPDYHYLHPGIWGFAWRYLPFYYSE